MNAGAHIYKILTFPFSQQGYLAYLVTLLSALVSTLFNVFPIFILLLILIAVDLRFGIKKYIKRINPVDKRIRKNIKSKELRKTLSKLGDYFIIIVTSAFFEVLLLEHLHINYTVDTLTITSAVAGAICLVEALSIDENFEEIYGISIFGYIRAYFFREKPVKEIIKDLEEQKKKRIEITKYNTYSKNSENESETN